MNFSQLRFVREAVRRGFNLTAVAQALHTSQPGVSKGILELEDELGFPIFVRQGKRLRALTEPGRVVVPVIERILLETENLKRIGQDFATQEHGDLTIATTHTQARYTLPSVVHAFRERHPAVRLALLQGSPRQIADMVLRDEADLAIATEAVAEVDGLVSLPCFSWEHVVVVPPGHPLLADVADRELSLDLLAAHPLVTYDAAFAGRTKIDEAFALRHLEPDIVLAAIDADVIKTYVEEGLGVGIVAGLAWNATRDPGLVALPAGHLFGTHVTHLAVKRGVALRGYAYRFIELVAPGFDRRMVERLVQGGVRDAGGDYQL